MITKKEAGTVNGKAVAQYTLENENGLAMTFYTYGGIIQSLLLKDRQGIARDVELGFDTLDEYVKAACYYGAPIGRYANRIGGGQITMDGRGNNPTPQEKSKDSRSRNSCWGCPRFSIAAILAERVSVNGISAARGRRRCRPSGS